MGVTKDYFLMNAIKFEGNFDCDFTEKLEKFDFNENHSFDKLRFVFASEGEYIYIGKVLKHWSGYDEEFDGEIEFKSIKKSEREKIEKFAMKHFGKKGKVKMVFFAYYH